MRDDICLNALLFFKFIVFKFIVVNFTSKFCFHDYNLCWKSINQTCFYLSSFGSYLNKEVKTNVPEFIDLFYHL